MRLLEQNKKVMYWYGKEHDRNEYIDHLKIKDWFCDRCDAME